MKPRDEQGAVGRSVARVEGREKVLGKLRFTADHTDAGMVHAALVQSTIAHGTLLQDELVGLAEAVGGLPGVLYVLTPANCPELCELPADLTDDLPEERRPPLSDYAIEYAGQHLAVVVAETFEQAVFAAERFYPPVSSSPAVLSATETLRDVAGPETEVGRVRHGTYKPDHFTKLKAEKLQYTRGERDPTLEAARVVETYATPVEHHNPMELSCTIASWAGEQLTLRDTTRWIMGSRKTIASYFGVPEGQVRVICPFVGGAFGSKGFLWKHVALAAVAARAVGRTVKLVVSRREMFTSVGHRPATLQQLSLAADSEGRLTSVEHHVLSETSTVAQFTEPAALTSRNLYRCPHVAISHQVARLHKATPCFMRAPGEASGVYALESAMDELAYALDVDPLALRRRNHAVLDEDGNKLWSGKHLLACYDDAARRFGWEEREHVPRAMRRDGTQVGWGMATAVYPARRMPAGCKAAMTRDGCAQFFAATHELGTGVRTVMTQVASDALGVPVEHVQFYSGDSTYPAAPYTGASQTSATVGSAVHEAATLLRGRLCALAAEDAASPLFGVPPQAVTLQDGWLIGPGASPAKLDYRDLLARVPEEALQQALTLEVEATPPDLQRYGFDSFGAHFCEVEVDEELGKVRVRRWCGTFDGGRILNPQLARDQIVGGTTFGIGMALMEATHYDPANALPVNANLAEYHLPTIADVPEFAIEFIQKPDLRLDPMGVRGIGELGIVGAPAAIANAIFHATGKRLRALPVTCDQLLAAAPAV